MSPLVYLVLFAAGIGAGIINTVAGGGSVLTLPALIFAGIPATAANATNRIGIIAQNLTALRQFRRDGIHEWPLTWRVTLVGTIGAVLGAMLAAWLPDDKFERILGFLMLALLPLTLKKAPKAATPAESDLPPIKDHWARLPQRRRALTLAAFFLLGIYGGFLQAGIGIMILLVLAHYVRIDLVEANYVKLAFILITMIMAFGVFLTRGVQVAWVAGLVLTAGQMIGAYVGSWVAIRKGEQWIKAIMVISILLSSGKLLGLY